jgi:hypothetical protein
MTGEPQRAPADVVNGVLTKLLYTLSLRPEHRSKLSARGLSLDEIARKRYVSAPATRAERQRAADALASYLEAFGGGVPGFFHDGGRWRMVWRPSGYFTAVRDEHGYIQALSQRVDVPRDGNKYTWLSTDPEVTDEHDRIKYPLGAKSGAPPHFAGRHLMYDADEIVITEGSLKSEVISFLSRAPVVGVNGTHGGGGVNSIAGLCERLKTNFPRLRRTILGYDKDLLTKPNVRAAVHKFTAHAEAAGFQVRIRTWPGTEKGLDDYLLSQLRGQEAQAA